MLDMSIMKLVLKTFTEASLLPRERIMTSEEWMCPINFTPKPRASIQRHAKEMSELKAY